MVCVEGSGQHLTDHSKDSFLSLSCPKAAHSEMSSQQSRLLMRQLETAIPLGKSTHVGIYTSRESFLRELCRHPELSLP